MSLPVSRKFRVRLPSILVATTLIALATLADSRAQSAWSEVSSGTPEILSGVVYGNGIYLIVGEAGTILSSADATTWSAESSGTTEELRGVVYGDGQFVISGDQGTILTSPDGSTWTAQLSGTSAFLSGIAYGNGIYTAVGGVGTIISSPDAINWNAASSFTSSFLQGVWFGGGKFVASGAGGRLRTSSDGVTWARVNSGTTSFLTSGGYFGGKHYVVGQNGRILSSADGLSWTAGNSGLLDWLRAFATDGTSAVICGDNGILLKSADGVTWDTVASGQSSVLNAATYAQNRFIVVGEPPTNRGLILVSERDPGLSWNAPAHSVSEEAGSVTLTIERLGSTSGTATVQFQTIPGSATEGVDFTATSGTASFAIGESTSDIVIPIANNLDPEPTETFTVELSSADPTDLIIYNPTAVVVSIIDGQSGGLSAFELWKAAHFDEGELENPTISGTNADPDNDGNANAIEFLLGLNPKIPDAGSGNSPRVSVDSSGTTVTWSQRTDHAVELSIEVESSATLGPGSWQPLGAAIEVVSTDGPLQTVRVVFPTGTPALKRKFFRLNISLLP